MKARSIAIATRLSMFVYRNHTTRLTGSHRGEGACGGRSALNCAAAWCGACIARVGQQQSQGSLLPGVWQTGVGGVFFTVLPGSFYRRRCALECTRTIVFCIVATACLYSSMGKRS